MIFYETTIKNPSAMISMTGLTKSEFDSLLPVFEKAEKDYVMEVHDKNKKRKRMPGGGRKPKLQSVGERLFFILFYLKTYPLQQVIAVCFGLSLSQSNYWIHRLSDILKRALGKGSYLSERDPATLEGALKKCLELSFIIDGTERKIQRPKQQENQKRYYSGKKKGHTVKNNIIANVVSRKAVYLSGTYEGKKHDKKIADEENPIFPKGSILFKDTGFQGYEPENTTCYQPAKKPRGKNMSLEDRFFNKMISGVRIIVEHVISGIKRMRIVKDVFRNTKNGFSDLVMEIACGLHNLRETFRAPDRTPKARQPVWN
jgi:hypothetical protein